MTEITARLSTALADRYNVQEVGQALGRYELGMDILS